jgi:hypothetical protein
VESLTDDLRAERDIVRLLFRYSYLQDAGDFEAVGGLFAHATICIEGSTDLDVAEVRGSAEIVQILDSAVNRYSVVPRTKHVTSNVVVDVSRDGQRAVARSYYTVMHAREGFDLQPVVSGRYLDELVFEDGVWRFARRWVYTDLIGDLSSHMKSSDHLRVTSAAWGPWADLLAKDFETKPS